MANNRMFLVHIPSGLAIFLGKRMGHGWYTTTDGITVGGAVCIHKLFHAVENETDYYNQQDDFAIALEDASGATLATGAWQYGPHRFDGLVQLIMTQKKD